MSDFVKCSSSFLLVVHKHTCAKVKLNTVNDCEHRSGIRGRMRDPSLSYQWTLDIIPEHRAALQKYKINIRHSPTYPQVSLPNGLQRLHRCYVVTANDLRSFSAQSNQSLIKRTYYSANGMLLSWSCLLQGIVDYQVQEKVIPSQNTTNFATTLKVNEKFFVHKLI